MSPARSSPRDTAQEQGFDVLIHYPHHPRAGERVVVVRRLQHGGSMHFAIDQPDGTRGLLPAWMTEPWAQQLPVTEVPRLALEALRALRSIVDGALLSLSSSATKEGDNDERGGPTPAARSAHAGAQGARSGSDLSGNPGGSDATAETADDRVRCRRRGSAGRGCR